MSLCESIETLSMAYLDDELAGEERRELEMHLADCTSCRGHLDTEASELELLRAALVAPPAPDLVKARIARALDEEDRQSTREGRRRWSQWVLPGSALAAAAAALALFIGTGTAPTSEPLAGVAHEAVRQQTRSLPLEVQGASTGAWLHQHFGPVEPPQFDGPDIQLVGARGTAVSGHDAALLRYIVSVGGSRVALTTVLISGVRGDELRGGDAYRIGERTVHMYDANGQPAITYVDANQVGYVFTSERLSAQELLALVATSDLIGHAQKQLR